MGTTTAPIEDAIRELRLEIETIKLDLDAKIRSLKVLENVLKKMTEKPDKKDSYIEFVANGEKIKIDDGLINLDELDDSAIPKKRTLVDDIRDVVCRFGSQEFAIAHVESVLKKLGIEVAGKTPRTRISVALVKLCDETVLIKTFTGAGNVPNKYRVRSSMTAAEIYQAELKNSQVASQDVPDSQSDKE